MPTLELITPEEFEAEFKSSLGEYYERALKIFTDYTHPGINAIPFSHGIADILRGALEKGAPNFIEYSIGKLERHWAQILCSQAPEVRGTDELTFLLFVNIGSIVLSPRLQLA